MTRREAIVLIAGHPRVLVSVKGARVIAAALGHRLDALLYLAPDLVRTYHGPALLRRDAPSDLVQLSDLGATICVAMGLYASADHALQSPQGGAGKRADYIGRRAAVRLARHWGGEAGVRELRADVPELPAVLLAERPPKTS